MIFTLNSFTFLVNKTGTKHSLNNKIIQISSFEAKQYSQTETFS